MVIRNVLTLYQIIQTFNYPKEEGFGNTVGKAGTAGNQKFSPFPTVFAHLQRLEIIILSTFNLSSANALNLVASQILSRVKLVT